MTEPSTQDQVTALIERVQEQGIELASLRRLVYAMGSHLLGGPPGTQALHIWHQDMINPPPPPVPAAPPSPTVAAGSLEPQAPASSTVGQVTAGAAPNPISAATQNGISQIVSPPVSPAGAGSVSPGAGTPSQSTAAAASSPPAPAAVGTTPAQGATAK